MRHGRGQRRAARDATSAVLTIGRPGAGVLLREVWDGVWRRVLTAEATDQRIVGLAGFGEGVVAGVEVLALLELVLEEVFLVGELAIEAEELLLFFGERLSGRDGQLEINVGGIMIVKRWYRSVGLYIRSRPPCSSGAGSLSLLVRSLQGERLLVGGGVASSRRRWA